MFRVAGRAVLVEAIKLAVSDGDSTYRLLSCDTIVSEIIVQTYII